MSLKNLDAFLEEPNTPLALRRARSVASSVSQLAKLGSSTSYETSTLPHLINQSLLSVVIESSILAQNAQDMATRSQINVWDKMMIPVQGGQFKIAADSVAQDTSYHFRGLNKGSSADALRQKAMQYRKANIAYQSAGTKLLSSVITANKGSEIISAPVIAAQPELVRATFALWQAAVDYLDKDLQQQRAETLFAVTLAGLAGGLVILGAFAVAIALSRALAERTLKEFESLGFHDPLTGLPNRRALLKTLRSLPASRTDERIGLIIVDLRHFKKINDRFGDHNGDSILREVAEELIAFAEPDDFVCRTGGTEFLLLRRQLADAAAFEQLAAGIIRELSKERSLDGHRAAVECNAGLFIGQPGAKVTDHILVDAALALRSAKHGGPGKFELFTHEMRTAFEVNGETAKELLKALNEGDIVPWYQPQVDIRTGEIVGAEALVRWVGHGTVRYPGSFLPAAMEAGYMEQIDKTVREKGTALCRGPEQRQLASRPPEP
ncbi:diguanylate cyclase [Roseibium salinum]|nr:diguanylate cyclase [Roseibium salinum]